MKENGFPNFVVHGCPTERESVQWCEEMRGCMHWASVLDAVCILKVSNWNSLIRLVFMVDLLSDLSSACFNFHPISWPSITSGSFKADPRFWMKCFSSWHVFFLPLLVDPFLCCNSTVSIDRSQAPVLAIALFGDCENCYCRLFFYRCNKKNESMCNLGDWWMDPVGCLLWRE